MAQFVFTCPYCKQQFMATDEMIGTVASCTNCGATFTVQKQITPIASPAAGPSPDLWPMILGVLGLILWLIPIFTLPVPIIGFILSYNRNYKLGIILNSIALGLSIVWTLACLIEEL
ncbi:MAG: hypothetical protein IKB16_07995 [Lentisphaeria bacterium]|nr:hypothetical protein [Lentisphaeria bacterium]